MSDSTKQKPRIIRESGRYFAGIGLVRRDSYIVYLDGVIGSGDTPLEAYQAWRDKQYRSKHSASKWLGLLRGEVVT